MARTEIEHRVPRGFKLKTVVFSHGWFDLPPFAWEAPVLRAAGWVLDQPTSFWISQPSVDKLRIEAELAGRWSTARREQAAELVARMLGLSLDVAEFYRLAGPRFRWAKRLGAGRMLRGASAFEDAVKMMATTNCSWSLTRLMVGRLIESLGEPAPGGAKVFPTPAVMADQSVEFYRKEIRAGYRGPYFKEFARLVATGEVDPESWPDYSGTSAELVRELIRLPGVGKYVAENLCKLFGRYDGLGLDSWCLKKFPQIHGAVEGNVERAIRAHYEPYGNWKGLALWLDLTKDWFERDHIEDDSTSFQKD